VRAVAPKGVTDDERALRRDLVRVLAATSMNFYAKEPEGERLHRDRWRERIRRTRDVWRLRYTQKAIHLANNHALKWRDDAATRWPALVSVLTALRDCRGDMGATWETLLAREVLPASWFEDPNRRFWCAGCDGKGDGVWSDAQTLKCPCGGLHRVEPRTFLDLVSWTNLGTTKIQQAEEAAHEAVSRLRAWGVAVHPRRIVWRVIDHDELYVNIVPPRKGFPNLELNGHRESRAWQDAYDAAAWPDKRYDAPKNGMTYYRGIVGAWSTHWFDARPNPYEPMRQLLDLGVVLDTIDASQIVLSLAPLGGPRA